MGFDGDACIRLLRNKTEPEQDRVAAAESLMHFPRQEAIDALWDVLMDETDDEHIREEAAGSLGTLWIELGIDYERLVLVPEAVADFDAGGVVLDAARLGRHSPRFQKLFGTRDFMNG